MLYLQSYNEIQKKFLNLFLFCKSETWIREEFCSVLNYCTRKEQRVPYFLCFPVMGWLILKCELSNVGIVVFRFNEYGTT